MNKSIDTSRFQVWKDNLQPAGTDPVITTDALIKLDDLELFLKAIKGKNADSIRINLVRFDWKNNEPQSKKETGNNFPPGCRWSLVNGNKTQVAIAINGATNYTQDANYITSANDIIENGNILLLIPGGEAEGPIGHNPPSKPKPTGG